MNLSLVCHFNNKVLCYTAAGLKKLFASVNRLACSIERKRFLTKDQQKILRRNSAFSSCHKGRRAFVIGNGPSLNSQNLSLLKNEITYTCNAFYLHPILSQWQPKYHSIVDPGCFDGRAPMGSWFKEICENMPGTKFFVLLAGRDAVIEKGFLPENETYYCAFSGRLSDGLKTVDITRPIPSAQSVSLFGICLALYMGCNPIYLIGMDHDWLATRKIETHFYEGEMIRGAQVSANQTKIPYYEDLRAVIRLWDGYKNIKVFAESLGKKIYNATNGGFLDVFERISFESLFDCNKLNTSFGAEEIIENR